jgi:glycosyltransferase involved in cell wall biosynthesis
MFVSVILNTYQSPTWLEKSVWGYAAQSHCDFELLIADDGSDSSTADCIANLRGRTGLALRHLWQPKQGFGKCRILNSAIAAADSDYLVFSDGDCIPRRDFLAQHVRHAMPNCFLSGGVVRLPRSLSDQVSIDDISSGRACQPGWLAWNGWRPNRKLLLLLRDGLVARLLDAITTTHPTFNGHNSSAWKADLVRVNGFDERMGYGGLDRELGERLVNAGVRPRQIRHRAVCVHLDHPRDYVDQNAIDRNRDIRQQTKSHCMTRTQYGIYPRLAFSASDVASGRPLKAQQISLPVPLRDWTASKAA